MPSARPAGTRLGHRNPAMPADMRARLGQTELPNLVLAAAGCAGAGRELAQFVDVARVDRKSTRLNSSHGYISYAVFCLKKKKKKPITLRLPRYTSTTCVLLCDHSGDHRTV